MEQFRPISAAKLYLLIVIPAFLLVGYCQYRLTVETRAVLEHGYLYEPFLMRPFSRIIEQSEYVAGMAGIRAGDQLLAVDGRPYTGESVLHRELRKTLAWRPFVGQLHVIVEHPNHTILAKRFAFPALNFGAPPEWVLTALWIMPIAWPLVGIVAVAVRPRRPMAWLLFGITLTIAQFDYFPAPYLFGARDNINPMELADWFRHVAVVYRAALNNLWPVWLLLFIDMFTDRWRADGVQDRLKRVLLGGLLAWVMLKVALAWAQSEDFSLLGSVHRWLSSYDTFLVLGLALLSSLLMFRYGSGRSGLFPAVWRCLPTLSWVAVATSFFLLPKLTATLETHHYAGSLDKPATIAREFVYRYTQTYRNPAFAIALFTIFISFWAIETKRQCAPTASSKRAIWHLEFAAAGLLGPFCLPVLLILLEGGLVGYASPFVTYGRVSCAVVALLGFLLFVQFKCSRQTV